MLQEELKSIFKKHKSDNEIYHDLAQYHVREILLITSLYDAFILEEEEKLNEKIFGEYYGLDLSNVPRITSASDENEAETLLKQKYFDFVIITMRTQNVTPIELAAKLKEIKPYMPVFLLLYDNSDIAFVNQTRDKIDIFEKVFVWNRDTKIFLAIIKYFEDKKNCENDTEVGLVRVILLVENSIRYYSRYLPILYSEIIKQTQRLITKDNLDGVKKILRMRARPKVLLAVNYEEAIELYEKFKNYMLCVISDVKFPYEGSINEEAGIKLLLKIKSIDADVPFLLQSSESTFSETAILHDAAFINKNSETLSDDLREFILDNLGFGDFIFRDKAGNEIKRASSIEEFKYLLKKVPSESVLYHGSRNHFSAWLMARGEIQIAEHLEELKITDFPNADAIRDYIIRVTKNVETTVSRGGVVDFEPKFLEEDNLILRLAGGSFGGKGRGIAFINTLLQTKELFKGIENVSIKIPKTAVVGAEEYDNFINRHELAGIQMESNYEEVKQIFLSKGLSEELESKLRVFLDKIRTPIAVRSSGMFEDSISESFSGIYQTFLLPNNHESLNERLKNLTDAIKLVYASIYSKHARSYFEAINYRIEDERMSVVLQEIVGDRFENVFFPHISGVAQSYNFYPISRFKPEDGICIAAVGLGKYVIDAEKAYRFSPRYPKIDIIDPETQLKDTQSFFYAIDMERGISNLAEGEDITLKRIEIADAEELGVLDDIVSVYDPQDKRMKVGLTNKGPRVVNFAGILKYDLFPFAKVLSRLLEIIESSMGLPVEIEFAVNLDENNPGFYILQLKPLIRSSEFFSIDIEDINKDNLILYTERGMGNGKVENITDIIYAVPELFNKALTQQMAVEIEKLNDIMKSLNRNYVLIGPGRWGTRDRWLGIPVTWPQISCAKIIVETDLEDFKVDASLGSHFFHNITSMNIGYLTVHQSNGRDFIDWEYLKSIQPENTSEHFVHLHLDKPVKILMDGKKSISLIEK
ncbi:MAG: PEP/pyruvate-binding domain-containing protein [Ignavibacteria bacterium]